jgi:hypothetical protein
LVNSGIHPRKIDIQQSIAGRGSAKQWVSNQFAQSAEACRRRNSKAATSLLVMMDADQLSVAKCMSDLDAALATANQPKLDAARDPIARLIPKWSIETWILYLSSNGTANPPVTEDKSYKDSETPEHWTELIPQAAQILYAWTRTPAELPEKTLDSLRLGIQEISRALPVRR